MAGLDILNGFASKIISDCIDITIDAIRKADKNRTGKNQNIQTRIYQVTIDALNEFPYNKYKKKEQVYDAAESMLKQLKDDRNEYKEAVRVGLKIVTSQATDDICKDFLETLRNEICKNENDALYKEIVLIQQTQANDDMKEGFKDNDRNHKETHGKLNEIQESINSLKKSQDIAENYGPENVNKIPIKNRAEEYAEKWNANVFLNNFDERDEKKGKNIKLREIYLEEYLPHYKWKSNINESNDLKKLLSEYIVYNIQRKMLLILGLPGIGKSTLITWIIANLVKKKDQVLVYQFASDLKNVKWEDNNILNGILKAISLNHNEAENKVLIIDGFDEIYAGNDRERILNRLYYELKEMNYVKRFSLIITCRENYINKLSILKCEYITLQAWDSWQIRSFGRTYGMISKSNIREDMICKVLENIEIFGIPLILYMVLALDVAIEKSSSIVDIYDQIFLPDGGRIYDRCYDVEHRINKPEIKEHIHRISQKIAFWMFENNADVAFITQEKFEEICKNEMNESGEKDEDMQSNTLIGNFFKLKHCEGKGTDELQFVHRTIYEYFVAVYFYESMYRMNAKDKVAGKLGELLKGRRLSNQILEFIKCKFDSLKEVELSNIVKEIFDIMLQDGMTFYTKVKYNNVVAQERNIFSNMLEIVRLWNPVLGEMDEKIITYLQCNRESALNLKGISFSGMNPDYVIFHSVCSCIIDLGGVYLKKANLSEANLGGVNLCGADLRRANLSEADLSETILSGANLEGAHLAGANLKGAYLERAYLGEVNLNGVDLSRTSLCRVDLSGAILSGANLEEAYLGEADLRRADLEGANLSGANLIGANLIGADLSEADFYGANLSETIFDEEQVNILYEKYDLSKSRVLLSEKYEIISYREYYISKQKG